MVALFEGSNFVAQKQLTLDVGEGPQDVTFSRVHDQLELVPPASLDATVACEPYVREGAFPDRSH
jgi:hypothetical protein